MKNRKLFVTAILLCMATILFAEEKKEEKWQKPSGNQICFIVRVALSNNINTDFYTIGLDAFNVNDRPITFGFLTKALPETSSWIGFPNYGTLGEFVQANIAKKDLKDAENGFYLPTFRAYLFNLTRAHFYLPANIDVSYPSDAKYVYIGTFIYTLNESDFTIKNARRIDEFDDAQKLLNEKLGEEVQLVRAEISEHKE
ncbi:MAG: hypothetical protein J6I73_10610 [Treponema sp.]|nr:hypothetical protein [Treponema sp.]